ncbi:hypothetical protein PsYK624_010280 [Phanerochaete sordida]|uniref:Uncharacterized protein n=1 Tax=Phanerochaete sordida TaxID=48140 RepID=A0A9P3FXH5_9APHY|nr:hypothetical protein PsYK624_010280 [Phanerochaete sordida]
MSSSLRLPPPAAGRLSSRTSLATNRASASAQPARGPSDDARPDRKGAACHQGSAGSAPRSRGLRSAHDGAVSVPEPSPP